MLSWSEQYLRGMFVQAMMYGVYLATFAQCLRWLIYQDEGWKLRPREGINWPMLTATIAIFILSTVDLSLELRETLAIIMGEKLIFFKDNIAGNAIECAIILIADAILILRCWAIYTGSWRIVVIPIILWLSSFICMILIIYFLVMGIIDTASKALWTRVTHIFAVFYVSNCMNNLYTTGVIIYRILRMTREGGNKSWHLFVRIFAESGVLYAATSLALLIATFTVSVKTFDFLGQYIADAINITTAGIAFNLILIRVSRYRANQSNGQASTPSLQSQQPHSITIDQSPGSEQETRSTFSAANQDS